MTTSASSEAGLPRLGPALIAYIATLLGAMAAWRIYRLEGIALALTLAIPVAALVWLIRQGVARRRACGNFSKAGRAYLRRFVPLMIAYAAMLMGAVWLNRELEPTGLLAVALAVLPALPLIGVIWAMGRLLVEEKDEYQRSLHVRQFIIATGFMLVIACVWGFLEQFGQVPHLPFYWAFIIWCAGLGVGSFVNEMRS